MIYIIIKDYGSYEGSSNVTATTSVRQAFKECSDPEHKRYVEQEYGGSLEVEIYHNTQGYTGRATIEPKDLVTFEAFTKKLC